MSLLELEMDRSRKEAPLYRQLSDQIARRIRDGELPRGSRLPTVRELAEDLGVTRVTVHNAYNHLKTRGLVDSTVGRGTFVTGSSALDDGVRSQAMSGAGPDPHSVMTDINRLAREPGMRSLAVAEPDSALHPTKELMDILQGLRAEAGELLHYGDPQGDPLLRLAISGRLARREIAAKPGELIVTNGVTQGLSLVTSALCERGDKVLVEEPTYLGFLNLLETHGVEPIGVPLDEEGPSLAALEERLRLERPRFFYTIPCHQNPTGLTMSATRRDAILDLARDYQLTLVEDEIYRDLRYDGAPPPPLPLRSGDRERVIYLDGYSKSLLPGLRIGYVLPPPALLPKLAAFQQARELGLPSLLQRALAELLRRDGLEKHLGRVLPEYRRRRDALLEALAETMPEGVTWTRPEGGYCCWLGLAPGGRFEDLYESAIRRSVAYAPGEVFLSSPRRGQPDPERAAYLRLAFSALAPGDIRRAVEILAELIRERMPRTGETREERRHVRPLV